MERIIYAMIRFDSHPFVMENYWVTIRSQQALQSINRSIELFDRSIKPSVKSIGLYYIPLEHYQTHNDEDKNLDDDLR
ncbi:hypothetical protein BLOT_013238 [Blomia tropicalis]|nr:hypothetical protein BLOT_013238 [Blomia tropicalis]